MKREKESFHYPTARVQKGHLNEKGFGQHETRGSKMSIKWPVHSQRVCTVLCPHHIAQKTLYVTLRLFLSMIFFSQRGQSYFEAEFSLQYPAILKRTVHF